jgi:hypothetical protein
LLAFLIKRRLRCGILRSFQELKDAIRRFLDKTDADPKPHTWINDPNKIAEAVQRGPKG